MDADISVGAVMTPLPFTAEVSESLDYARSMMKRHEIRHLPVLQAGRIVGVISDRDLKLAESLSNGESEILIDQIAVHQPYVVDREEKLAEVADEMAARHISSALVEDRGKLVGIFTSTDACRYFGKMLREQ